MSFTVKQAVAHLHSFDIEIDPDRMIGEHYMVKGAQDFLARAASRELGWNMPFEILRVFTLNEIEEEVRRLHELPT